MADARRARVERRATRNAHTAPGGPAGAHRSPSPVVNTATSLDAQEQQGSSPSATEQVDGRTSTLSLVRAFGSLSHARLEMLHGWRALAMMTKLLHYRPTPDRHNDWLQRIEELVAAVGDSVAFSCSFRPQPSLVNGEEQDAPPPSPRRGANPEPRWEARPRERPSQRRVVPGDEPSCQMAAVPEMLVETGFPLLLGDSLKKCQVRCTPIFLYHEHWVNADTKEYHVDVIVKANDSQQVGSLKDHRWRI
ncbi:hypothetical protein D1007_13961 [Hordeum vulgare]|nr:hypothetical protein D1007_13961 [Hordeum vulgare]